MGLRGVYTAGCIALLLAASVSSVRAQYVGWVIPDGAREMKSPSATAAAAARGKELFARHCARCHGPEGTGNGPDSDHAADLTDVLRTELNPEGVLFYKVLNGHGRQLRGFMYDMPAFQGQLSNDEIWAVVEHLKVLRTPRP